MNTVFVSTVAINRNSGMGIEVECFRDTIKSGFGGFQTVFPGVYRHKITQSNRGRRKWFCRGTSSSELETFAQKHTGKAAAW